MVFESYYYYAEIDHRGHPPNLSMSSMFESKSKIIPSNFSSPSVNPLLAVAYEMLEFACFENIIFDCLSVLLGKVLQISIS